MKMGVDDSETNCRNFDLPLTTSLALSCFQREAEEVERQTIIDLLEPQHPACLHRRNGTRKGYALEGIKQYMYKFPTAHNSCFLVRILTRK